MDDMKAVMAPEITQHEAGQIDAAKASGRTPVVFVDGLCLLPSSWDRWQTLFQEAGYATLAPGWPDDPESVAKAKAHPEVFAGKSIREVADHFELIATGLVLLAAVSVDSLSRRGATSGSVARA